MTYRKTKVPAFTIMEVTISMLVAAIVVAMTYTAYGIMGKSWLGFKDKNGQMAVVLRLDQLLKRDFEQAEWVAKEPGGIFLQRGGSSVHYQMAPGQVVRTAGINDTFKVKPSMLQLSFEGRAIGPETSEMGEGPAAGPNPGTGGREGQQLIDELAFTADLQNNPVPFHYKKAYSAVDLIRLNP